MTRQESLQDNWFEFSVIVPFFQREKGILTRAVYSALNQVGVATPRVVVIDDGSPSSAESELSDIKEAYPDHLVILRQENRGPGAARNLGIQFARENSQFIAFLDSDDTWIEHHLVTAKRALDAGCDFYFCDAMQRDGKATVFQSMGFPDQELEPIESRQQIFQLKGDLFKSIITACPIVTPAVVYREKSFAKLFRTDLRTAGEDYYFWLEIAACRRNTSICTVPNVQLGYGLNLFISARWGSPERIRQLLDGLIFLKDAKAIGLGSDGYGKILDSRIEERRQMLVENALAGLRGDEQRRVLSTLLDVSLRDPMSVISIPFLAAHKLWRRCFETMENRRD